MGNHIHIPEELLYDILRRLPVKTLGRFQLVSNSWNSLISSPSLFDAHQSFNCTRKPTTYFERHCDPERCIFYRRDTAGTVRVSQEVLFPLPIADDNMVHIIEVVYGVVIFLRFMVSRGSDESTLVFWNPEVKKHVSTPLPPGTCKRVLGAGFDASTNDLKAVFVPEHQGEVSTWYYDVFSARAGAWRKRKWKLPESHRASHAFPSHEGCFFNGSIYWITYSDARYNKGIKNTSYEMRGARGRPHGLLFFDCESEEFDEMELPDQVWDLFGMPIVFVHEGLLSVRTTEPAHPRKDVPMLWTMKEYGVWTIVPHQGMDVTSGRTYVFNNRTHVFQETLLLHEIRNPC